MGAIIQNGNIGAIIKNGIVYGGGIIEGGSGQISEIKRLTEQEWLVNSSSSPRKDDEIYLITNENGDMILYQYQGNNRILRKDDISDYEFWYEDVIFPDYLYLSSSSYHNSASNYAIPTTVEINSSENYQKSFEIDFNIKPVFNQDPDTKHPYCNIIANKIYNSSGHLFQIFAQYSNNIPILGIGDGGTDVYYTNAGDITNKDIRVVYDRNESKRKIYIDNVLIDERAIPSNVIENNNPLQIGLYGTISAAYSPFNGKLNYIGFKWLDEPTPPTPSGADGLTYSLSVDNNYHLNIIEYDNGVQSQTTSLNDESLDYGNTPVTFGDLIISYGTNDVFVIKPNYVDGKSIKYEDVLYSGDNIIVSIPDYAETQDDYEMIGWVE